MKEQRRQKIRGFTMSDTDITKLDTLREREDLNSRSEMLRKLIDRAYMGARGYG